MEYIVAGVLALLQEFAVKYPLVLAVLSGIGVARLIFKPLFTFLASVADATPTPKDNELILKIQGSSAYKVVAYVLDLFGSIKLPKNEK